ncbi:MAG: flavin reductase family protein [Oscillospiraceae bacterium]|jgi:flavin reductase (DIM6/NTAB) family NADH-FMN oxidoreductase RutF|nr:flavin reductase family protein [Oscillospiraceae bacterium]
MKRVSSQKPQSMIVQPCFIVGTYNDDGSPNFAPITWISVTVDNDGESYMLVLSTGAKRTGANLAARGIFSANLASVDMLGLVDYFGSRSGSDGPKNAIHYEYENGQFLKVPTLNQSRWVYECEVVKVVNTAPDTNTYFARIVNTQVPEEYSGSGNFDVDLVSLDPVVYSGTYHSIARNLGGIGDFMPPDC